MHLGKERELIVVEPIERAKPLSEPEPAAPEPCQEPTTAPER